MEFNKIFAAVLVAGIIAMFGGFIAKKLVHPEKLAENAYNIEVVEVAAPGAAKPMAQPILAMIAAADVARGEKIAKSCAACHSFNKGGPTGVGPNLYGTVNGPKHHAADFAYSGALIEVGGQTWTYAELNKFLWKPKDYAKNTKMSYAGLKKPEDRAALLAWLRTQADSPAALPSDAEIAAEVAELSPPEPAAPAEAAAPADPAAGAAEAEAAPAAADAKDAPPAKD
jgi:cytochrome c